MTEQSQFTLTEASMDEIKHLVTDRAIQGETVLLNMGPQHPSTHGVLRLLLELDGEEVINCIPDVGFLHTGIEKNMEAKTFEKSITMTDRLDYLNNLGNNLTYCMAIEKLAGLDVPERAQVIRVILAELQRIASHLIFLATTGLDVNATSVWMYCFREREIILDIFEMCSGQRMMTTFIRPGGLWRDVPVEFEEAVRDFIKIFPARVDEYEALLTNNPLFRDRTLGMGVLTPEDALAWGVTGPMLRASGVEYDLRKSKPYCGYEHYDFEVPLRSEGDTFARYIVRMDEMRQATRIIEQALDILPFGPVRSNNRKYVPPPRSELGTSMEALIHHFKLWTEGYNIPEGSVFVSTESPRGELGVYLESNGGPKPYRVHWRTPSFTNLQVLPLLTKNHLVADLVLLIGTVDIVLGDVDR